MFDASSLRKLKLPALLAFALLIALLGYYLLLTTRRTTYLNSSNLRLLTTIGHHVDDWIQRQQQIFRIVIGADNPAALIRAWKAPATQWLITEGPKPKDTISIDSAVEPPTLFADSNGKLWLELTSTWGDRRTIAFDTPILESLPADAFDIVLLATQDGRILKRSGQADLYLADLGSLVAAPRTFAAEASHTTDVDVNIAGNGYRLFIQPCCGRLRIRTMDSDHPAAGRKEPASGANPKPTAARDATNPKPEGSRDGGGEGTAARAAPDTTRTGLVVCGLVPAATLTERRYSISFSTVLIIAGLLLMVVVSWPFLKLRLIGTRQRVGLLDVLLLGISSLLVLSLGTLYLLDLYAYNRLKAHIDGGLLTFSDTIQSNMRKEIAAAYTQLDALQSAAHVLSFQDAGVEASGRADSKILVNALLRHPDPDFSFYPFFESFSLIDRDGTQKRKWTIRPESTPPIPVKEREYFLQLRENRGWRLPQECSESLRAGGSCETWLPPIPAFALESIRSITRTDTQAVLAMPTEPPMEMFPVAALALPMMSVIKPVLPPGFGFAVIEDKDNGRVVFHSDDRRNLIEQFFLETDLDRRLRSVVAARRSEFLDLRYWGRDYRAYVAPLRGFPWSLVTFHEKDLVRSVNVDWIVTTLLFLILYMLPCAAVCVFVLMRPARRATWLWPLPGGLTTYLQLGAVYVLAIIVFGVVIYAVGRGSTQGRTGESILLLPAFGIPPLVWLLTYLRVRAARRPVRAAGGERADAMDEAGAEGSAEPDELLSLAYMCSAALLLVITAVMPTIAFFKVAHAVQVVPFIKYTQLRLAAGLADRLQRAERGAASLSDDVKASNLSSEEEVPSTVFSRRSEIEGTQLEFDDGKGHNCRLPPVDIYHQAFETTVRRLKVEGEPPAHSGDPLPGFLEPLLPYYSELSVATRELLHDEADDNTRYWRRGSDNRIVLTNAAYGDGTLEIASVVPTFGSLPALFQGGKRLSLLELIAVFGAIGALAMMIAVFAARRVFLLDMPFWSPRSGSFPAVGQSMFVVCRMQELREAYLAGRKGATVDLAALASPDVTQDAWDRKLADQERVLSGEPILVDHFEHGSGDSQLNAKKLWFIEQLVQIRRRKLVILSSIGPVPLQRAARAGEPDRKADDGPSIEQRWASLLTSSFVVIDLDPRFETDADAGAAGDAPGRITKSTQILGTWWLRLSNLAAYVRNRQHEEVKDALDRESAANPYLSPIRDDLKRMIKRRGQEGLDREEILTEFEERASNYYEGLWACCSPVEKLVLEHLAEDGFANYRDGKVVRRLVSRGLVRRDPHLRLMNETFRRFVVSTRCRTEVGEVEQGTQASAWDHFKRPFVTVLAVVLVLFVTTQKSRFDAAMALIVGMTGVLPALLKLAGFLIGERQALPVKPN